MKPLHYAKLDSYNYNLIRSLGGECIDAIVIKIDSQSDSIVSDIATDITAADGNIYVEGYYLELKDMFTHIDSETGAVLLMIKVYEV